jgi:hypothetical protein
MKLVYSLIFLSLLFALTLNKNLKSEKVTYINCNGEDPKAEPEIELTRSEELHQALFENTYEKLIAAIEKQENNSADH